HGATGKGNDQCRFQLASVALEPTLKVIAPWRIDAFRQKFPGRKEMLDYCAAKNIPVKATASKPYSSDENCLHISYEAGKLEDPAVDGIPIIDFGMTVSPQEAPDQEEYVTIAFEQGTPLSVEVAKWQSGKVATAPSSSHCATVPLAHSATRAIDIVQSLNTIGGRNGVGRIDVVENRFVGMKSRGVYEAPGMTCLYAAHQALEQLTLDRDLVHLRDRLSPEVAEMVYYGFWYCAKMDALMSFIREAQTPVTGEVMLGLYKGNVRVVSRTSPNSLYDEAIASMEAGGDYNQTDAEGFLRITGLPLRVQGGVRPRRY
ncbi:MAG: argininosuccinate synthase, partial [Planctomycetaceae bacterium]